MIWQEIEDGVEKEEDCSIFGQLKKLEKFFSEFLSQIFRKKIRKIWKMRKNFNYMRSKRKRAQYYLSSLYVNFLSKLQHKSFMKSYLFFPIHQRKILNQKRATWRKIDHKIYLWAQNFKSSVLYFWILEKLNFKIKSLYKSRKIHRVKLSEINKIQI